jgi:hypothetical protein
MVVAITLVPATVADKWPAFVAIAVDETDEVSCYSTLTLIVWVIAPPPTRAASRSVRTTRLVISPAPLLPHFLTRKRYRRSAQKLIGHNIRLSDVDMERLAIAR